MRQRLLNSRLVLARTIEKICKEDRKIVHLTSDGNDFTKKFRKNHYDVGIAEQNLIGIASGFALKGYRVVLNGISGFIIANSYLQIRNNICFPNLNVVMVGCGSGLSYGQLGYTHHSLEDIALLNTLPHMKIYLPSDAVETEAALRIAIKSKGPSYIRIRSGNEPVLCRNCVEGISFQKPIEIKKGEDAIILTYGACVQKSLLAAKILSKKGIKISVYNINSLGLYSLRVILKEIRAKVKCRLIVCVEEHYSETGLGSLLANIFIGNVNIPFLKLGVKKEFCDFAGTGEELIKFYGLDEVGISNSILKFLKS